LDPVGDWRQSGGNAARLSPLGGSCSQSIGRRHPRPCLACCAFASCPLSELLLDCPGEHGQRLRLLPGRLETRPRRAGLLSARPDGDRRRGPLSSAHPDCTQPNRPQAPGRRNRSAEVCRPAFGHPERIAEVCPPSSGHPERSAERCREASVRPENGHLLWLTAPGVPDTISPSRARLCNQLQPDTIGPGHVPAASDEGESTPELAKIKMQPLAGTRRSPAATPPGSAGGGNLQPGDARIDNPGDARARKFHPVLPPTGRRHGGVSRRVGHADGVRGRHHPADARRDVSTMGRPRKLARGRPGEQQGEFHGVMRRE
jgi:hypothetical protein